MRIEVDRKLFVGVRVDNKLRDAIEHCPAREKAFFDGSDERYLLQVRAVDDRYVGKVVEPGVTAVALDDLKRNVLSILGRLPQGRRSEDDVKVFAIDPGDPPPPPEPPAPPSYY